MRKATLSCVPKTIDCPACISGHVPKTIDSAARS